MADTILVPVDLPDPEPLSPVLVEDLSSLDVVLLGHYHIPEQTPRDAAREQFEDDAQATLDEIAAQLADAGADVRTRLVFGKDHIATINRVMIEEDCAAELTPAPTEQIERILVPVPGVFELDRLPRFIRALSEASTHEISLFHVVEGEEQRERGEELVAEMRAHLLDAGFEADLVDTRIVVGSSHDTEILQVAAEYDVVVMYQATSRLRDHVLGSLPDRIADETGDPVIVVRRDYDE